MLDMKLRRMCSLAGIQGVYSNHSLRATSATQMFEMGVPEKIIQERTGHRSLEALRTYERSNERQHKKISHILTSSSTNNTTDNTMESVHFTQYRQPEIKLNPQNSSVSFNSLQDCTINIYSAPAPSYSDLTYRQFQDSIKDD